MRCLPCALERLEQCSRGHSQLEHARERRDGSGRVYCGQCERENAAARYVVNAEQIRASRRTRRLEREAADPALREARLAALRADHERRYASMTYVERAAAAGRNTARMAERRRAARESSRAEDALRETG